MHKGRIYFLGNSNSIHLVRWANELYKRGWECLVCTFNKNKPSLEFLKGIKVIYVPEWVESYKTKFRFLPLKYRFLRLLKNSDYDIFHIHSIPVGNSNIFFKKLKNLVISVWGSDIIWDDKLKKESIRRKWAKRVILESAVVITSTSYFMKEWVKKYLKKEKEIYVIPFGVDLNLFNPRKYKNKKDKKIRIVVAKLLRPKYGIDILIKAFKILTKKYNSVELHIIGDGEQRKELENLASDLNISSKVKFWGYVKNEDLPSKLSMMDIFAMPSIRESESFGVAAVEASAMSLPVVASNIGGIPEVVLNGKTGFLVKPGDVDELAKYLEILVINENLRKKMGDAGRRFVEEKYDWQKNVSDMEEIYKMVIQRSKK